MGIIIDADVLRSADRPAPSFFKAAAGPRAAAPAKLDRIPRGLVPVLIYLAAITIFGKGPTYLGIGPIYFGEIVLVLSLLWIFRRRGFAAFLPDKSVLTASIIAFLGLGALLLARGLPLWGMDAVRDSAACYYALFYFVGYAIAREPGLSDRIWQLLTKFWLVAMIWGTIDLVPPNERRISLMSPLIPSRGVPVLWSSLKELIQHAGLGTILVLGQLYPVKWRRHHLIWSASAVFSFLVVMAAQGRAEKLAVLGAWSLFLVFRFTGGRTMKASNIAVQGFLAVMITLPTVMIVSPQAAELVASGLHIDRFSKATGNQMTGTALWRWIWWKNLYEGVMTENPLLGLGFGADLDVYNPYLRDVNEGGWPTRSPHNFNVTIGVRMGLLGALLWSIIFILGVGHLLIWGALGRRGNHFYSSRDRAEITFWAGMLLATWINGSFGVLMEGPVLGVWFWFALGFGRARAVYLARGSRLTQSHRLPARRRSPARRGAPVSPQYSYRGSIDSHAV